MIPSEIIFISDLVAIFAIYLIINLSLNLEFGYGGVPNFGKVLAVAAGAFVVPMVTLSLLGAALSVDSSGDNLAVVDEINRGLAAEPLLGVGVFAVAAIAAMAAGAGLGLVSAYPAVRLRGDYLAITLLAFGEIIRIVGINYEPLVGGTLGVSVPDVLSFVPDDLRFASASVVLAAVAGVVYLLVSRFTRSPVGRLLRATRDDEVALQSLGRDPAKVRIKVLMLAGMIGALGGMMYASYAEGVIAFGYNRLNWTFLPFVMVIVGGLANNKGVLLGTFIFVVIRKLVVYYNDNFEGFVPFDIIWLDYLLLGGLMLAVLLFRPKGILPERPQ
ncbi:ABC-type branched-chain amino acid transport system, permease component [Cenarchaeum symbiosum A]|uniref:ABC-type branched-chain amino acid transport system, permease component n=1 Tax=Cenarchaeum symbiosum (strain A) TaxID=414004 RepID=A0RWY0_CENSY|nr:ABC-type branched-chain amino acid transport system, permease component [Cenarchaeum symbiosum A]